MRAATRTSVDDLGAHVRVAVRFLQLGGSDPDLSVGRNRLASSVQHLSRILVRLEAGESEPQLEGGEDEVRCKRCENKGFAHLNARGTTLARSTQHDASVVLILQFHRTLPQLDRVRNLNRNASYLYK